MEERRVLPGRVRKTPKRSTHWIFAIPSLLALSSQCPSDQVDLKCSLLLREPAHLLI